MQHDTELEDSDSDELSSKLGAAGCLVDRKVIVGLDVFELLVVVSVGRGRDGRLWLDLRVGWVSVQRVMRGRGVDRKGWIVSVRVRMGVGVVVVMRACRYTSTSFSSHSRFQLTVVDAQPGEFGSTDPVCSDLGEEDTVDGSHGDSRGPCL